MQCSNAYAIDYSTCGYVHIEMNHEECLQCSRQQYEGTEKWKERRESRYSMGLYAVLIKLQVLSSSSPHDAVSIRTQNTNA